ncbi:glycosyltransferase family 4 protein [Acinetobacter junii]|uniref:glycosyltransferase family 4 protein n=1 Tax=Acinetobacter junii TaxID=40215 RepID=UPI001250B8BB|nr:glycosyltransferase family 4 protein [Acinetobacter junii]
MRKVCFLIGSISHSGGTERVTTVIANEFANSGEQVHILSLHGGEKPFFEQSSHIVNACLFEHKISMKTHFFETISKIRKYLIKNQIDILIVVDSISCVFTVPACIGLDVKHICWEHFNLKVNLGSRFRNLGRWLAARWCDQIVTLTERDKSFWVEKYRNIEKKMIVIPNPSPFNEVNHVPSLESKMALAVGRLDYIKGFDLLLEAWAIFCKQNQDWTLSIVGGGAEELRLKQIACDLGISSRVIFWGQQKNVDQFYRQASIYCLSSRNEGFPMVLLEAQSYGLPIVAFDCDTGPAEIVLHGENGYLVPTLDIHKLSKGIQLMSNLDENEYKKNIQNSKKVIQCFNVHSIMLKWNHLKANANKV